MACNRSKTNTEDLDKVLAALNESPEPMKADDIAEKTGIDKDVVSKLLTTLKKEEKITSPKRCFYSSIK